jgi:hypothetical protein
MKVLSTSGGQAECLQDDAADKEDGIKVHAKETTSTTII